MKLILTGDLHFHERPEFSRQVNGRNSRLQECVDALKVVADRANATGATTYILGDVFHVKGLVHANVHAAFCEALDEFANPVFILVGNHDQFDASGSIHSLLPYQGYRSNVRVIDSCPALDHLSEQVRIHSVPAMKSDKAYQRAIDAAVVDAKAHPSKTNLLFTHGIINGAIAGGDSEHVIQGGATMDKAALSAFDWVFCGDIHRHAVDDNRVYVGSPLKHTFSDDGDIGAYVEVDIDEDGRVDWSLVPVLGSPYFRVVIDDRGESPHKVITAVKEEAVSKSGDDGWFPGSIYIRTDVVSVHRKKAWLEALEAFPNTHARVTVRGGPSGSGGSGGPDGPDGASIEPSRAPIVAPNASDEEILQAYLAHVQQNEPNRLDGLELGRLAATGKELLGGGR